MINCCNIVSRGRGRGGRGIIQTLAFEHFPTSTSSAYTSSITRPRIVSVSSYVNPTSNKIFSTSQTIFKLPSASWVVGFANMASAAGTEEHGHFKLSETSVLKINKGDITKWFVDGSTDAIVNPANPRMLGGGGADGAIHRAAGPELREACFKVPEVQPDVRCPTGEARITPGFKLPASHVIHTVGPIYDSDQDPKTSLINAYRNSLAVAKENNIKYIAFPAISCGVYGYPFEEAATVAISTVKEFANDIKEVHFVLFGDEIYDIWLNKAKELLQA